MKKISLSDLNPDVHLNTDGEDLDVVNEAFECSTNSVVVSTLKTFYALGISTDASVKDNVMALTSKIAKLLISRFQQRSTTDYFIVWNWSQGWLEIQK